MSEYDDRKADALIEDWKFAGTSNPVYNRIRRLSNREVETYLASEGAEVPREDCTCYWRGFIGMSREQKEQIKREHIEAGRHTAPCLMATYANPMYSRAGDAIPPSYTRQMQRADEDAEQVEYGRGRSRFRTAD